MCIYYLSHSYCWLVGSLSLFFTWSVSNTQNLSSFTKYSGSIGFTAIFNSFFSLILSQNCVYLLYTGPIGLQNVDNNDRVVSVVVMVELKIFEVFAMIELKWEARNFDSEKFTHCLHLSCTPWWIISSFHKKNSVSQSSFANPFVSDLIKSKNDAFVIVSASLSWIILYLRNRGLPSIWFWIKYRPGNVAIIRISPLFC